MLLAVPKRSGFGRGEPHRSPRPFSTRSVDKSADFGQIEHWVFPYWALSWRLDFLTQSPGALKFQPDMFIAGDYDYLQSFKKPQGTQVRRS